MAVLINRPPQIVVLLVDREQHLIQVPRVARSRSTVTQLIDIGLPQLPAPIPHRFISEDDATFGHRLFDIAVAQAEAEGEPDTVVDHLCQKPMVLIQVGWWIHEASMVYRVEGGQRGRLI